MHMIWVFLLTSNAIKIKIKFDTNLKMIKKLFLNEKL